MALFHVLSKFDALDAKIGRTNIPPAKLPVAKRPRSRAALSATKENTRARARTRPKAREFGSFGRDRSELGESKLHAKSATKHQRQRSRPASAFARSRGASKARYGYKGIVYAQPPHLWSWKRESLAAASVAPDAASGDLDDASAPTSERNQLADANSADKSNPLERRFYYLRISVEDIGDTSLDVHVTDLTSTDRPTFVYRSVSVNAKHQIIFRRTPIPGFGPETLTVISPVDDFPFVTKPAQMLGHTLRIRVLSTWPKKLCIIDTCCHFRGRNKGPRALETEEILSRNAHRHRKPFNKQRRRQRPASAMAALTSTPKLTSTDSIRHTRKNELANQKVQNTYGNSFDGNSVRPSSPGFVETLAMKSSQNVIKRQRRPSMLTEDKLTSNEAPEMLKSPGTQLRNVRQNLRLQISKFRQDIDRSRQRRRNPSRSPNRQKSPVKHRRERHLQNNEGSLSQDVRTMIDPDQLLKDLATYGQAARVTLKAWSPKNSQAGHF